MSMRNINLEAHLKDTCIEKLSPTKEVLIHIKASLMDKDIGPFNQIIGKSVQNQFENWIIKEYPSLISQKEDLKKAILRRFKNLILKTEIENNPIDFDKQFLQISKLECESNLPTEANRNKNFGLSKSEFVLMLKKLREGNEEIIERIFLSEFQKCTSILMSQTGCNKQEAYDLTMDALVEIRKEFLGDKILYGNLESYFITKSMNQFFRKNNKKRIEIAKFSTDHYFIEDPIVEDEGFNLELKELVHQAIESLSEECRDILKLYYFQEWSFQDIAIKLEKGYDAIRKQATRCRDKFKSNLKAKSFIRFKSI